MSPSSYWSGGSPTHAPPQPTSPSSLSRRHPGVLLPVVWPPVSICLSNVNLPTAVGDMVLQWVYVQKTASERTRNLSCIWRGVCNEETTCSWTTYKHTYTMSFCRITVSAVYVHVIKVNKLSPIFIYGWKSICPKV